MQLAYNKRINSSQSLGDEVSTVKIFSLNLFRVEDMATRDLHNNVAISLGRNSILINNEIRYSLLFIPHILINLCVKSG